MTEPARESSAEKLRVLIEDPDVISTLRGRARALLSRSSGPRQHDSLSLVNRAVLRLLESKDGESAELAFEHREEMLAYVVLAMRSALLDEVRKNSTARRGGGAPKVGLDDADPALLCAESSESEVRDFFEVLAKLGKKRPLAARIVTLKYLLDSVWDEVASELAITVGKAREEWEYARAWLMRELHLDRGT